jgi:hypothetical protein
MQTEAFEPFINQATGAIASKRIAVTDVTGPTDISDLNGEMLRIANIGAAIAYVTFSKSAGAVIPATNAHMAIGAGAVEVIKRPAGMVSVSAICDAGLTTTLNIVGGNGL